MKVVVVLFGWLLASAVAAAEHVQGPDGARIHYDYRPGDGPPVVLVHGFSTPMWVWEPLRQALLDEGRAVLAYDLYGRGGSERIPAGDSLAVFQRQLLTLLTHLEVSEPIDLIGLSMGGAIVASFTAEHPGRVRRLVLIAPFNSRRSIYLMNVDGVGEWFAKSVFTPAALRWGYRRNFADADIYLAGDPQFAARKHAQRGNTEYALALLSSLRNIIQYDQLHWYERVGAAAVPTLLIWGEEDRVLPFSEAARVQRALGQPEFHAIAATGHLPHRERGDVTNPLIVEFLNRQEQ